MSDLRISKIEYSYGSNLDNSLHADLKHVTILVGPNNSGKSETLRDIEGWCLQSSFKMKLLSNIHLELPTDNDEINALLTRFKVDGTLRADVTEHMWFSVPDVRKGDEVYRADVSLDKFREKVKLNDIKYIRDVVTRHYTIRLDGRTRFDLILPRSMGNLADPPRNFLAALFYNDEERIRLRKIIFDEFGLNFYLDPTAAGTLMIRMSQKAISLDEEKSLKKETVDFFRNATLLSSLGDGIQAFVGILLAVFSLPHKIILVDEPEAFLHPPTARSLGRHLTDIAIGRNASVIASTHSAEFLMGSLERSNEITIIRLTYDGQTGTATQLPSNEITNLMKDPLLRSTDTLTALFHKAAIVTESDPDRVFYTEINRRLRLEQRGIDDAVFLNAQNKQTIHRIVGALRKIGVPSVGIYDLDVIKYERVRDTTLWNEILSSANVPSPEISHLETERQYVEQELDRLRITGQPDPFKKQGLTTLTESIKTRSYKLLEDLNKYGIFILDVGELERWLRSLGISSADKKEWIVKILDKLGLEGDPTYVKPQNDDVWKFIDAIKKWTSNQNRLGMSIV